MLTAKEIMTREVVTVAEDMPIKELAALFLSRNIGGAPVVDAGGKLVGVVTESDLIDQTKNVHIPTVISILDSVLFLESPNKMDQEIKKMIGCVAGDICTRKPVTVSADTPASDIATIMSEKKIHTLPVLSGDAVVGVIGKTDLIRAISKGM